MLAMPHGVAASRVEATRLWLSRTRRWVLPANTPPCKCEQCHQDFRRRFLMHARPVCIPPPSLPLTHLIQ